MANETVTPVETNTISHAPAVSDTDQAQVKVGSAVIVHALSTPAAVKRPGIRRWLIGGAILTLCVVAVYTAFSATARDLEDDPDYRESLRVLGENKPSMIPVNAVRPRTKTLERILEQPGTIKPWSQVELYAKTSGYLKSIRKAVTPRLAAVVTSHLFGVDGELGRAARLSAAAQLEWARAPQIDIGSPVAAGDFLLEIETPEHLQSIVEKKTIVKQREAELEAARTALATYAAAIESAQAAEAKAKADVRESEADHVFRTREFSRIMQLVQSRTVPQEIADEKERQVNAALAAWESSLARVKAARADLTVSTSKLDTAQADIKVKETLVQAARDQLRLAQVLAEYSRLLAPFDGCITFRDVDEGDFVQNASSGQARRLMTVTALDQVKIVLQVPDRVAPWIQVGTEAMFTMAARGISQFKGQVARIGGVLDPQTRTMQVEIDVNNRDRRLLPGMYVPKVALLVQRFARAQAIPATAVYNSGGENYILEVQNGIAQRQRVRIRYDDGKEMEVVKLMGGREVPLDGSEELIVSNKGEIADGQRVNAALLVTRN